MHHGPHEGRIWDPPHTHTYLAAREQTAVAFLYIPLQEIGNPILTDMDMNALARASSPLARCSYRIFLNCFPGSFCGHM